jgi:hypothetical protein
LGLTSDRELPTPGQGRRWGGGPRGVGKVAARHSNRRHVTARRKAQQQRCEKFVRYKEFFILTAAPKAQPLSEAVYAAAAQFPEPRASPKDESGSHSLRPTAFPSFRLLASQLHSHVIPLRTLELPRHQLVRPLVRVLSLLREREHRHHVGRLSRRPALHLQNTHSAQQASTHQSFAEQARLSQFPCRLPAFPSCR